MMGTARVIDPARDLHHRRLNHGLTLLSMPWQRLCPMRDWEERQSRTQTDFLGKEERRDERKVVRGHQRHVRDLTPPGQPLCLQNPGHDDLSIVGTYPPPRAVWIVSHSSRMRNNRHRTE